MLAASLLVLLPALAVASPIEKRYTNRYIQSYRTGTCLSLEPGTAPYNGAPLVVCDCANATTWDLSPGSGSVIVSGTDYALDAGENPHDFVDAKVWQSYPGLTQQTWFYTYDHRLAITGGTQCLDEGDNGPQTYTCTTGDTNQIWNVISLGAPIPMPTTTIMLPPPSTMACSPVPTSYGSSMTFSSAGPASASSVASAGVSGMSFSAYHPTSTVSYQGSALPPPGYTGYPSTPQPIQFVGNVNNAGCLDVQDSEGYDGSPVNVYECQPGRPSQLFYYRSDGAIQWVSNDNKQWCLDAGSNPSDGTRMKLWQCYSGLPQQTWKYLGSVTTQLQTANNQCLDVEKADGKTLQTWTCSSSDPQQEFALDGYQSVLGRRK